MVHTFYSSTAEADVLCEFEASMKNQKLLEQSLCGRQLAAEQTA